ncbi:MAG TPA: PBP1A family penicillin-binding protein [Pyrinomonadaceae bacterium]|nr:PBP1A family penicillin-binding protein [Pyrinomonadaceae bacterium]
MSNRIKAKTEDKKIYKSLRYRLKVDDAKTPPEKGFLRRFFGRIFRLFFNPITLLLFVLLLLGAGLTFGYFWTEYSEKVDQLLRGEVFTKNAGVYSAPRLLKDGAATSKEELVDYLKSAGYIEKNSQADEKRSRYKIGDNFIEIEPGDMAVVDDKKIFPALQIKFTKDGKTIASINDLDAKKEVNQAKIEPKLLSSITAEHDGRRKTISFDDLPEKLKKAIIVTEDRGFFEHYGVNFRGIARALWRRYEGNDNSPVAKQGGSSITQQLVKNLLLSDEYSYERKAKEALMSIILETRLSKEEIFTLYANQIYLGQQAGVSIYGVGEAANAYFGKDVTALTLPEAAMIAGIIRSPNRYNPYKNPEKTTERRNQVLQSMLEANEISQKEFDEAKATKLTLYQISVKKDLQGMPYFSQFVVEQLPKVINDPEALQHLRIFTTIDPDLQKIANDVVVNRLDKLDKAFPKKPKGSLQAALIAIRPKTGEIVAMVGGRNYLENQFNRATDAMRQPGSVFKPFVYATAINSAYDTGIVFTAASIFKDEKKTFTFNNESYSPNNYGDVFSNQDITLRDALVKSKNTITVDLGMQLNIGKVMNLATKAGFPRVEKAYPSMALGTAEATPLQVATAYSVFANLGDKTSPIAINRITTGEGKTIVAPVTEKKNVLKSDVAYIMDDIMKDVINRGTAVSAQAWGFKNVPGKFGFAGKTGTSRDGWFAGFTPELVCVVYVGFDENDELGMKGADSALPIWADFMRQALNIHPEWNGDWTMPDSVRQAEIDTRNGSILRELDPKQADLVNAQQKVLKKNATPTPSPSPTPETPLFINSFLSDIPFEFRRVELFISGTLPINTNPVADPNAELDKQPEATPTPFTTWEDAEEGKTDKPKTKNANTQKPEVTQTTTVMVCPLSGMRATVNCPEKEAKTFNNGTEPKEFCTFHNKPQQK